MIISYPSIILTKHLASEPTKFLPFWVKTL
nr:MAG TPA: hypothetical protein [Caudoviricetes sp.]